MFRRKKKRKGYTELERKAFVCEVERIIKAHISDVCAADCWPVDDEAVVIAARKEIDALQSRYPGTAVEQIILTTLNYLRRNACRYAA